MEEEEERQGDVVRAAAVPGHLKEGSRVAAAALIVVWKEISKESVAGKQLVRDSNFAKRVIV